MLLTATSSILSGFLITKAYADSPAGTYAQCRATGTSCSDGNYAATDTYKIVICCCQVDSSTWKKCEYKIRVYNLIASPNDPSKNCYRLAGAPVKLLETCIPYIEPIDPGTDATGGAGCASCTY